MADESFTDEDCNRIGASIISIISPLLPTAKYHESTQHVAQGLETHAKEHMNQPHARVFLNGSVRQEVSTSLSKVNLCLLPNYDTQGATVPVLPKAAQTQFVAKVHSACASLGIASTVLSADVPSLQLTLPGLTVDVSADFQQVLSSQLVRQYIQQNREIIQPLCIFLVEWANYHKIITPPADGGLSPFLLILLLLNFLLKEEVVTYIDPDTIPPTTVPAMPPTEYFSPDSLSDENKQKIAKLAVQFAQYYSKQFDFQQHLVSLSPNKDEVQRRSSEEETSDATPVDTTEESTKGEGEEEKQTEEGGEEEKQAEEEDNVKEGGEENEKVEEPENTEDPTTLESEVGQEEEEGEKSEKEEGGDCDPEKKSDGGDEPKTENNEDQKEDDKGVTEESNTTDANSDEDTTKSNDSDHEDDSNGDAKKKEQESAGDKPEDEETTSGEATQQREEEEEQTQPKKHQKPEQETTKQPTPQEGAQPQALVVQEPFTKVNVAKGVGTAQLAVFTSRLSQFAEDVEGGLASFATYVKSELEPIVSARAKEGPLQLEWKLQGDKAQEADSDTTGTKKSKEKGKSTKDTKDATNKKQKENQPGESSSSNKQRPSKGGKENKTSKHKPSGLPDELEGAHHFVVKHYGDKDRGNARTGKDRNGPTRARRNSFDDAVITQVKYYGPAATNRDRDDRRDRDRDRDRYRDADWDVRPRDRDRDRDRNFVGARGRRHSSTYSNSTYDRDRNNRYERGGYEYGRTARMPIPERDRVKNVPSILLHPYPSMRPDRNHPQHVGRARSNSTGALPPRRNSRPTSVATNVITTYYDHRSTPKYPAQSNNSDSGRNSNYSSGTKGRSNNNRALPYQQQQQQQQQPYSGHGPTRVDVDYRRRSNSYHYDTRSNDAPAHPARHVSDWNTNSKRNPSHTSIVRPSPDNNPRGNYQVNRDARGRDRDNHNNNRYNSGGNGGNARQNPAGYHSNNTGNNHRNVQPPGITIQQVPISPVGTFGRNDNTQPSNSRPGYGNKKNTPRSQNYNTQRSPPDYTTNVRPPIYNIVNNTPKPAYNTENSNSRGQQAYNNNHRSSQSNYTGNDNRGGSHHQYNPDNNNNRSQLNNNNNNSSYTHNRSQSTYNPASGNTVASSQNNSRPYKKNPYHNESANNIPTTSTYTASPVTRRHDSKSSALSYGGTYNNNSSNNNYNDNNSTQVGGTAGQRYNNNPYGVTENGTRQQRQAFRDQQQKVGVGANTPYVNNKSRMNSNTTITTAVGINNNNNNNGIGVIGHGNNNNHANRGRSQFSTSKGAGHNETRTAAPQVHTYSAAQYANSQSQQQQQPQQQQHQQHQAGAGHRVIAVPTTSPLSQQQQVASSATSHLTRANNVPSQQQQQQQQHQQQQRRTTSSPHFGQQQQQPSTYHPHTPTLDQSNSSTALSTTAVAKTVPRHNAYSRLLSQGAQQQHQEGSTAHQPASGEPRQAQPLTWHSSNFALMQN